MGRELSEAVGPAGVARAEKRLLDATAAFDDDRPADALRILRPLSSRAPEVAAVRELAGLALYRLGRWKEAAAHLEAFVRLTGSVERHPVLADCYRAVGRYRRTAELWEELGQASPSAAIVTEGRIVAAGALADQGELRKAIALLERGPVRPRRVPAEHHLRLWYALADLYERVGDTPAARELFARIAAIDPGMADVAERLAALG
ncbi:MAG TPA: tetratricopeptide repeat protein [Acidimicrobiales bacterium]|nr:tetratricopeptide repeat protein [Acidimicrobiales bacterium]